MRRDRQQGFGEQMQPMEAASLETGEPSEPPMTIFVVGAEWLESLLHGPRGGPAFSCSRVEDAQGAELSLPPGIPDLIIVDVDLPGAHTLLLALAEDPRLDLVPVLTVTVAAGGESLLGETIPITRAFTRPIDARELRATCAALVSQRRCEPTIRVDLPPVFTAPPPAVRQAERPGPSAAPEHLALGPLAAEQGPAHVADGAPAQQAGAALPPDDAAEPPSSEDDLQPGPGPEGSRTPLWGVSGVLVASDNPALTWTIGSTTRADDSPPEGDSPAFPQPPRPIRQLSPPTPPLALLPADPTEPMPSQGEDGARRAAPEPQPWTLPEIPQPGLRHDERSRARALGPPEGAAPARSPWRPRLHTTMALLLGAMTVGAFLRWTAGHQRPPVHSAAAAAPPAAASSLLPPEGLLEVSVNEGSAVVVDGSLRGHGPKLSITLPVGLHELKTDATTEKARVIEILRGRVTHVDLTLGPAPMRP